MRIGLLFILAMCALAQTVRPWEGEGNKDALAVRGYIDWSRASEEVQMVKVKVDTIWFYGSPAALVTVTVFTSDSDSVSLGMKMDFESLADPQIMISDTTYLKETSSE